MKKNYNPKDIEQKLYQIWEKEGYFKSNVNLNRSSFCIVMPPPNITGSLHMGHAFQQTIMDILIRYNRMQGKNTLWQLGTDHAGIATQMIVERKLISEENRTKESYSREEFLKKIWNWKNQTSVKITNQIRRLGSSVDWDRELFTLDPDVSAVVQKAFITLYKSNLIYRKKSLVNWDSKLKTVISDLEIEHRSSKSFMWYIKYYFSKEIFSKLDKKYVVIATTRPETMFADSAIAINPKDKRYNHLIGLTVKIPLINRIIPIIADSYVDIYKGTGCLKISPAHDFYDYEIGYRHKLPMINIFTIDGKICEKPELYIYEGFTQVIKNLIIPEKIQNLERFKARREIVKILKDNQYIKDVVTYEISLPYGDRSNEIIEPRLTDQWFLSTSTLSYVAIKAVREGQIQIIPNKYENMYFSWMNNIQDWCISRQLWWGHRIPVWNDNNGNVYVGRNEKEIRKKNLISRDVVLNQDKDVLDTWFSSALWILASLDWPKNKNFFKTFYPTNVLVSGFDIIFFWIARMIMLSMYFIKENDVPQVPFRKVYITGLVRDEIGQKMSKSKGNIIDPIDLIDGISLSDLLKKRTLNMMQLKLKEKIIERTINEFPKGIPPSGTDALRLTLASLAVPSRNITWDTNRLKSYKNFCNKLWNVGRFVLIHIKSVDSNIFKNNKNYKLFFPDKWILIKYNLTIKKYRESLDSFRFDLAATILFDFIKYSFCDWYLELVKLLFKNKSELLLNGTKVTLVNILESLLRLAHPIIPFITEEIWKHIKDFKGIKEDSIMLQKFPKYQKESCNNINNVLEDMSFLKNMITSLRGVRAELNIKSSEKISLFCRNLKSKNELFINKYYLYLKELAKLESITILSKNDKNPKSVLRSINNIEFMFPLNDNIKSNLKLNKLISSVNRLKIRINQSKMKLNNNNFLTKAPIDIVKLEKNLLLTYQSRLKELLIKNKNILDDKI